MMRDVAADERPRERLRRLGESSLSASELLAIILNTGIKGESVLTMSQRVLRDGGGLRGLHRLDFEELARMRGVGESKASRVKAALELGRRLVAESPEERLVVNGPDDIFQLLGTEMASLEQEHLRVVLLDTRHRVISVKTVYRGSVNQAQVRIGELFRDAVRANATAQILVHNHPSGDPAPSAADISLTADVVRCGELLDIAVLDHMVIGQGRWVSLKRLGLGFASDT
ncbi:MAG: DNA repair protein RadC [Chloroflexia bacterium]|nr:DNA repair protein RadC [Chloroflexia bacterium]MDQ3614490.1 DNA repair protein RadC [Chloroflexota bacterium]